MQEDTKTVDLLVENASQLPGLLLEAEAALRAYAASSGTKGILVTRHDFRQYTVALEASVPFGETWEKCVL
jgi:hypothetical protein